MHSQQKIKNCREVMLNDNNDNYFDYERCEQEVISLSMQHAAALLVEQSVSSLRQSWFSPVNMNDQSVQSVVHCTKHSKHCWCAQNNQLQDAGPSHHLYGLSPMWIVCYKQFIQMVSLLNELACGLITLTLTRSATFCAPVFTSMLIQSRL